MMDDKQNKEIDRLSGVETTGHEWDGLKELNNPAPRWWLWVFYATVIWSVVYWILYPAWPTLSGATQGVLGQNQYKALKVSQDQITARQSAWLEKFTNVSFDDIKNNPELYAFARAGGAAAFKDNCATCHGSGAAGGPGYPNLNDDDWLWGGTVDQIYQTIRYGVRSGHDETRISQMPAFGQGEMLKKEEIASVAHYVLALNPSQDGAMDPASETYQQGEAVFKQNCASCHGEDGKGNRDFGAPNLVDAIWLYGSGYDAVYAQVTNPRHGVMPYWEGRLDPQTIRQLALYVHSLGGGENAANVTPAASEPSAQPEGTISDDPSAATP